MLLRREFDQGSHLTVYNSGYVLFSAGKRNTVFHIHDCCGDYAYDAAEGKGDVIEEEYFENCEWHISHPREILLALNVHPARLTRENAAEIWDRNGLGQNGKAQITADTLRWSKETCFTAGMYCYFQ